MTLLDLIVRHEIDVEWMPKIVWVRSRVHGIDPIGVKRDGNDSETLEAAIQQLVNEIGE